VKAEYWKVWKYKFFLCSRLLIFPFFHFTVFMTAEVEHSTTVCTLIHNFRWVELSLNVPTMT